MINFNSEFSKGNLIKTAPKTNEQQLGKESLFTEELFENAKNHPIMIGSDMPEFDAEIADVFNGNLIYNNGEYTIGQYEEDEGLRMVIYQDNGFKTFLDEDKDGKVDFYRETKYLDNGMYFEYIENEDSKGNQRYATVRKTTDNASSLVKTQVSSTLIFNPQDNTLLNQTNKTIEEPRGDNKSNIQRIWEDEGSDGKDVVYYETTLR